MNSESLNTQAQTYNLRTLGMFWVIYGIIRFVIALWLISFATTATLMFGPLLNRVPDPFALMSAFHFVYTLAIILSLAIGVLGVLAGLAFLARQKSGRTFALIAAFLSLSCFPLGIILGTYTLIALLPMPAVGHSNVPVHDQSPDLRQHASAT